MHTLHNFLETFISLSILSGLPVQTYNDLQCYRHIDYCDIFRIVIMIWIMPFLHVRILPHVSVVNFIAIMFNGEFRVL